jgi:hypothetical protein
MGHLFYIEGITASTPGLFTNVLPRNHWNSTVYAPNTLQASRLWAGFPQKDHQDYDVMSNGNRGDEGEIGRKIP